MRRAGRLRLPNAGCRTCNDDRFACESHRLSPMSQDHSRDRAVWQLVAASGPYLAFETSATASSSDCAAQLHPQYGVTLLRGDPCLLYVYVNRRGIGCVKLGDEVMTESLDTFREGSARSWLEANCPPEMRRARLRARMMMCAGAAATGCFRQPAHKANGWMSCAAKGWTVPDWPLLPMAAAGLSAGTDQGTAARK